jgi:hypothetical protein
MRYHIKPAKNEPETSAEYDSLKSLLNRVLVTHAEIARRESEYRKQSKLNPNRRGPKPKKRAWFLVGDSLPDNLIKRELESFANR